MKRLLLSTLLLLCACASTTGEEDSGQPTDTKSDMDLGAFSVSLTVADLAASRDFYEKLGFEAAGGEPAQNWLVLRNGEHTIGLFQGMFEENIMTFNPGGSWEAEPLSDFPMCACCNAA
jgi:hypothetical protein